MFALIFPSGQEWLVLIVIGLLLFGRRLPEVGKQIGKTVANLRQGMQRLRDEMDVDEEIREMRDTVGGVRGDLENSVANDQALADTREAWDETQRAITDPQRMLEDLTDETLSAPGPADDDVEEMGPRGQSLFEKEGATEGEAPAADA